MTHVTGFLTTCLQAGWAERTGWTLVHSLWQIAAITGVLCVPHTPVTKSLGVGTIYVSGA